MNQSSKSGVLLSYAGSLLGASLFVLGINIVFVPHGLYSGTLTGVAQMIESLLIRFTPIQMPENFNIFGIALLLINIPLMAMVMKVTSSSFPIKSIINILYMTAAMSIVPVPVYPPVYDPLTACIVGGAIAGFGVGFALRNGGSTGGSDLIGIYCSVKYPNFTVGKVSLIISVIVYSYALIFRDLNTVIYSSIFTIVYVMVLDHTHHQNIKTAAFIFTTNPESVQAVVNQLGRGATCWEGKGAYTGRHTHIIATVVSKFEVRQLKRIVSDADDHAFIIFNNKVGVDGNFERRL